MAGPVPAPANAAVRDLDALPHRYAAAIVELLFGALAADPARLGRPLGDQLAGLNSARRDAYRVLDEILPTPTSSWCTGSATGRTPTGRADS